MPPLCGRDWAPLCSMSIHAAAAGNLGSTDSLFDCRAAGSYWENALSGAGTAAAAHRRLIHRLPISAGAGGGLRRRCNSRCSRIARQHNVTSFMVAAGFAVLLSKLGGSPDGGRISIAVAAILRWITWWACQHLVLRQLSQ